MTSSPRALRVADRIQTELGEILGRRLKDPRLGFVTVTGVDVPADLRSAKIYISTLNDDDLPEAIALLEHARGFIRTELGRRLNLRFAPELFFRGDRSAERGRRIEEILKRIHDGEPTPADDDDDGEDDGA